MSVKPFIGDCVLLGLSLALVQAGTITPFTNRTAFNAAVGANTIETFGTKTCTSIPAPINSTTAITCSPGSDPAGTLQPGATYSAKTMSSTFVNFNIDFGGGYFTTHFLDAIGVGNNLMVTFPGPVTGVGFDTSPTMGSSFTITFNFTGGGSSSTVESIPNSVSFFGFQSSAQDIVSIQVVGGLPSGPDEIAAAFANFTFTPAGAPVTPPPATPAPPTWVLGAFGVLALVTWRWMVLHRQKEL